MYHKSRFTTLSGSKVMVRVGEGGIYGSPCVFLCLDSLLSVCVKTVNTYSYFNCFCFKNPLFQVDNTVTDPINSILLKIRGSIELGLEFSLE